MNGGGKGDGTLAEVSAMTTIRHVVEGVSLEGFEATVLSVALILAVGYSVGQLLRGLSSRGRHGKSDKET